MKKNKERVKRALTQIEKEIQNTLLPKNPNTIISISRCYKKHPFSDKRGSFYSPNSN